jgi:hypothetical protein
MVILNGGQCRLIELTRRLARRLRTVFRGCGSLGAAGLLLYAGPDGLCVRAQFYGGVAVEYHLPVPLPVESLLLPATALDDFAGGEDSIVEVRWVGPDSVEAVWEDEDGRREARYIVAGPEVLRTESRLPPLTDPGQDFLNALHEAARAAATEPRRFSLTHLQLRGGRGEVVGTDGRQLFIQSGFAFPWNGDVLIPALRIFASREMPRDEPVGIGAGGVGVVLRLGCWTFQFTPDVSLRFPDVDSVLPKTPPTATLHLSLEDAALLVGALRPVRAEADEAARAHLKLVPKPVVRLVGDWLSRPSEIPLSRSEVTGTHAGVACDPEYLRRALRLGFTELHFFGPGRPIRCQDGRRSYLWMPLSEGN